MQIKEIVEKQKNDLLKEMEEKMNKEINEAFDLVTDYRKEVEVGKD